MPSNSEKLQRFYECFESEDRVLLPIVADPDSIGSALAVKRLLWHRVSNVSISNINVIKRPDNLTMIRLLTAKLNHIDNVNIKKYNRYVLVDSQPNHHPQFAPFDFDVIIDHHPDTKPDARFVDIRPDYGANSSILTEYLKTAKIKPSAKIATGLFYGIKTDTSNFERQALAEDIKAFQYLFRFININIARKIEYAEIKIEFLKYFHTALENMKIRKNRAYVNLGPVINPDICVLIADFFMKIYSIDWTFVTGLYKGNLILIIRNDGIKKNAGKLVQEKFGDLGSAGGHLSMARAEIPVKRLEPFVDYRDKKRLSTWIIKRLERKK